MKTLIAVPIAAGLLTFACSAPPPPPAAGKEAAVAVRVERAATSQIAAQFEAGGIVRGRMTAVIASRVMAPVTDVRVHAGDMVRAGQVLVTLDGRDLQAQADRASAALTAARQTVRAVDSDRAAANAALTLATSGFDRVTALHAKHSATNHELEEATAGFDTARAQVASADAHAAEAAAGLTAAEEASKAATITASYATLTAPFAGRVIERMADPGVMAAPGVPLLTIEDTSRLRLEVSLDEARARDIAVGQNAEVSVDGSAGAAWRAGKIAELSRIDPARHSFVVKIDMPPGAETRSGAFGRARFTSGSRAALAVPARSVIRRGQMTFVFIVDADKRAHLRPVTPGASFGDRQEVLAGLMENEFVVDEPPPVLIDGAPVTTGDRP